VTKKQVRGRSAPTRATKRVTREALPDTETTPNKFLVWRFGQLDHEGEFGWQKLEPAQVQELEEEMVIFQQTPIYELIRLRWLKFIGTSEMTIAGQTRLATVSPQEDGLWQLHLQRHLWRIWGYYEEPEFTFLWWDSRHEVCVGASRHRRTS
jgi:hypothetical protein